MQFRGCTPWSFIGQPSAPTVKWYLARDPKDELAEQPMHRCIARDMMNIYYEGWDLFKSVLHDPLTHDVRVTQPAPLGDLFVVKEYPWSIHIDAPVTLTLGESNGLLNQSVRSSTSMASWNRWVEIPNMTLRKSPLPWVPWVSYLYQHDMEQPYNLGLKASLNGSINGKAAKTFPSPPVGKLRCV